MHLDALRAERWNRQARQQAERVQRRSIEELLHSPTHRGVVILGDPGSGKTTLLHYLALRAAQGKGYPTVTPRPPLYREERIFTRLVRVLEDDTNADVRDAAYGALLRLSAAPEQEPQEVA